MGRRMLEACWEHNGSMMGSRVGRRVAGCEADTRVAEAVHVRWGEAGRGKKSDAAAAGWRWPLASRGKQAIDKLSRPVSRKQKLRVGKRR